MTRTTQKLRTVLIRLAVAVLLATTLAAQATVGTTYISVEPIPNEDVVGPDALATMLGAGFGNLELWSRRLLDECDIVQHVIDALSSQGAISTVTDRNTSVDVAAGGFEAVTNPSYVFTVRDSGPHAVSAGDVDVLDNAMGYVLNQGGTAHFSLDNPRAYDFPLDYAVVSFTGTLSGVQAKAFFDHLGDIDPALWSGQFAGFTQVALAGASSDNSMVFLQPATSKRQFVTGLALAASTWPGATYVTVKPNGQPTTATAGIAFPGNDWIAFPNGDQYLEKLGNATPKLLSKLAALRQQHLEAIANLLAAIEAGHVHQYLEHQFTCPAR